MSRNEDNNNEVYHNLTESVDPKKSQDTDKWTLFLILCCITASAASFVFGYNIGSTNLPTPLIKEFFSQRYFAEFHSSNKEWRAKVQKFDADTADYLTAAENNQTENLEKVQEQLNATELEINDLKKKLDADKLKIEEFNTFLWTVTTALFVVGGMLGAFTSKNVAEYFGRKKGIIFQYIFIIIGSVLVFIAPYVNSPECIIISRFLFGVQGGMTCGLVPTYLSEISPAGLRGATGVIHQLFLTIGILIAQVLGFREFLGDGSTWHILLALPIVPSVLGGICLLLFFPETPRALLLNKKDEESARKALISLRHTTNVAHEMEKMSQESREIKSDEAISLKQLFTLKELRWPLITSLIVQAAQQLCGINAVFFYSESIFRGASIRDEHIQYAVVLTGAINVVSTIICVPLIDKLGRKPLLVYPMILIVIDFILLTVFMVMKSQGIIYSYLSIVCIIVFIMCFAVGLGPIPFIYVAECFRQDARSAALAICMFANWIFNLILTLTFPYLAKLLNNYVFLVFTCIVAFSVIVIIKKVPETKERSPDEIMAFFEGKKAKYDESSGKLMPQTKV